MNLSDFTSRFRRDRDRDDIPLGPLRRGPEPETDPTAHDDSADGFRQLGLDPDDATPHLDSQPEQPEQPRLTALREPATEVLPTAEDDPAEAPIRLPVLAAVPTGDTDVLTATSVLPAPLPDTRVLPTSLVPQLDPRAGRAIVPGGGGLATLVGRDVSAWFGDHKVLDRVSLEMPAGQVTALIGPSGCGKSTFLRILNRMHELIPTASLAGEVLLDGEDIYEPTRKLVDARKQIGMVFQKPNPFPAMSIYDNVVAGLKLTSTRLARDDRDEVVETCLVRAGLWKEVRDRLHAPGGGLSGGQQQRLCIARSLAVKPKVLLMDEPCSALDPTSTRVIEETMVQLQQEVTIVIVTHNMQQAERISQKCAFFLAEAGTPGRIVEHGDTQQVFHAPIDPRTSDYVNGRFG